MARTAKAIGLVLLGVTAGVAGDRLLGGPGAADGRGELLRDLSERQDEHLRELTDLMEERNRTEQEVALGQYFRLQEFRRFAEIGRDLSWIVPVESEDEDAWRSAAARTTGVRIPRVAADPSARADWAGLGDRLAGLQGSVDERAYAAFAELRAFAAENPWPAGESLAALAASAWSRPATLDRWLTLNRNLVSTVEGLLATY